jgi:spore coat protein A, manganese oxidase
MQFGPHRGRYMIHCHNLPHEDHDMMGQFSVGYNTNDPDPNDPIEAVKPHPIGQTVPVPDGEETATAEAAQTTQPPATQADGTSSGAETAAPVTAQPAVQKDVVMITTARHRLNKDITFVGTSSYSGTVTAATVVLYDVTPGRTVTKIGIASINSLGNWTWTTKPGPSRQVTAVEVVSSRGGTATRPVAIR